MGEVGRFAGYTAGGALLLGTILFLLDATNALGVNNYQPVGPPSIQNERNYWVAQFAHQHHILWDIIARDTLFALAFVALIVLSLALRAFVPARLPNGLCLGNLCRSQAALPSRLAIAVYAEAALLVGVALAGVMETGTPYKMFSLVTGALVGPIVSVWLGYHLGTKSRPEPTAQPTPALN